MPVSVIPQRVFCVHGHLRTSYRWLQPEAAPSMPARPGVLPALPRLRGVKCCRSVMVRGDESLCPACAPALQAATSAVLC